MLNCFTCIADTPPTVILPIIENQFAEWAALQESRVQNWLQATGFRAKPGSIGLLCNADGQLQQILVGLSHENDFGVFAKLASELPKGVYQLVASKQFPLQPQQYQQAMLAWGLANYQFNRYKQIPALEAKLYVGEQKTEQAYIEALLSATYLVRDLINTPAQDMMPQNIAQVATLLGEKFGATVQQIVGEELLTANYPAIHAVGRGSVHPPRFIDLRWGDAKNPKVTLVGKGVCFDSGGLDIKPASGMATMKKDMAGAAHVLGLAQFIMSLQLPIQLRVLIPTVENAVSGSAYHPGDVLATRKGLTIEVTNTDAEGRVILSDALHEGASEMPELLIDFASLTGAARVALGTDLAAMFTADDALAAELIACGNEEKDPIWRLPLYAPYRKLYESKVGDIANSSSSPYGGAITAALFLQEFVPENLTWVHFDIMAWNTSSKPGAPEGGEAGALRAVARYLVKRFPK